MPENTWIDTGKTVEAPKLMDKSLAWIKTNRETFIGASVVTLAAVIFAAYFLSHYADLRETAWKNLFIAQQTGFSGRTAEAQTMIGDIQKNYANTSASGYAILTSGDIYFAQAKYKEAAEEYSKLVAAKDKGLRPLALYSLGKTKEAAGETAAAAAHYTDFLSAFPEHFLAPEVHWALASAHEASGGAAEARSDWEKIGLLYPETHWAAQAKAKMTPAAPAKK